MKLIKNAMIFDKVSKGKIVVDILYDNKIIQIGQLNINDVDEVINLHGKLLLPGCIDAHVHFNDPGYTNHETFETGTRAAATGGITTIIDMPCTSIPAVINSENLHKKLKAIVPKAIIDFALWGGIRGNDFPLDRKIVMALWNEGIVGFKMYTISGMDSYRAVSYDDISSAFKKIPEVLYAFHAEEPTVIQQATNSLNTVEKAMPESFVHTRPVEAEEVAVNNILRQNNKNHIHLVHISSRVASEKILEYKSLGEDITFETCPHYLQFISEDFPILKGRLKTAPPVKFAEDRKFLREAVIAGKVDFIATDHAGCDWESEKELDDFSKVYNGIPGTQLMIPYLFSEFYLKEKVDLDTMIKLTSENAAKRYGLFPTKGSLEIGTDADFTIIDLEKTFVVDEQKLESIGKYSPFNGNIFNCSISKTIIRGETVYDCEKGILVEPGFGSWIKRC